MQASSESQAREALRAFLQADASSVALTPFGPGRIHETRAVYTAPGAAAGVTTATEPAWLLQRINTHVFPDYRALMENIAVVTSVLDSPLRFLPAEGGTLYHEAPGGGVWRLMEYVSGSMPVPSPPTPAEAGEAAAAYGAFGNRLAKLDPSRVVPVIPGFHDTPARHRKLAGAMARASGDAVREPGVTELAAWIRRRSEGLGVVTSRLADGRIPQRVCHNDAKVDNVLLDRETGRARCVVDLDTVMPGSPLYDLGDLLRSAAASVGEDEPDPQRVGVRWECARAVLDGFLAGAGTALTTTERRLAPASGWLLAMEQAIRYLSDHVAGDPYYGAAYRGQNLDRARNQAALAAAFESGGWDPATLDA